MERYLIVNPRSGTDSPTAEELRDAAARARHRGALPAGGRGRRRRSRARPARTCSGWRAATARSAPVADGRDRAGRAVRLRAVRDAEPLRPRPRARPGRPARGARRVRRRGAPRSTSAASGDRVFLNNVSLGAVRAARPPARAPPAAARRARAAARARADRRATAARRRFSIDGEPVRARVVLVANNALQARPALDRRARAARRRPASTSTSPHGFRRVTWEERTRAERRRSTLPARRMRAAIDGEPAQLRDAARAAGSSPRRSACSCRRRRTDYVSPCRATSPPPSTS